MRWRDRGREVGWEKMGQGKLENSGCGGEEEKSKEGGES